MPIEMLPASIEALRRIAAGERDVMQSVYIDEERRPEQVPRRSADAAVRLFERMGKREQRSAADRLKTRAGLRAFLAEAVTTRR